MAHIENVVLEQCSKPIQLTDFDLDVKDSSSEEFLGKLTFKEDVNSCTSSDSFCSASSLTSKSQVLFMEEKRRPSSTIHLSSQTSFMRQSRSVPAKKGLPTKCHRVVTDCLPQSLQSADTLANYEKSYTSSVDVSSNVLSSEKSKSDRFVHDEAFPFGKIVASFDYGKQDRDDSNESTVLQLTFPAIPQNGAAKESEAGSLSDIYRFSHTAFDLAKTMIKDNFGSNCFLEMRQPFRFPHVEEGYSQTSQKDGRKNLSTSSIQMHYRNDSNLLQNPSLPNVSYTSSLNLLMAPKRDDSLRTVYENKIENGPEKSIDWDFARSLVDEIVAALPVEIKLKNTDDIGVLVTQDDIYNFITNPGVVSAFKNVQKNSTAFMIWRVENMNVVGLPKDQYGIFYTDDCYVIYAASPYGFYTGVDCVNREVKRGPLEYHIHFWLGAGTTADKSGVAAFKTVELDDHLGGIATQHRETEGNESPRFKSYFKNGFRVLQGGSQSAFKHVSPVAEVKLYKIKGRSFPIMIQQESVSWKYFNSGDVFVITTPEIVFVWIGRSANGIEKLHGAKLASKLKTETHAHSIVFVDDGYEKTMHEDYKKTFRQYLSLENRQVLPPHFGGDDEEKENQFRGSIRLYQCSDSSGKYRVTEVKNGPLQQADLTSNDVFILDNGPNGIWVWVGKRASDKERSESLRNARGFVKKKGYPNHTHVTRTIEGGEPLEFKMLFLDWKDADELKPASANKNSRVAVSKIDAFTIQERPSLASELQLIDDGNGKIEIWRMERTDLVPVPNERRGFFFSGDSYLILYTYETTSEQYILYWWMGTHALHEEMTALTRKVNEKDEQLGEKATKVRIMQGQEPPHFLQLFEGKMTVFRGRSSEYPDQGKTFKKPVQYLLQIYGSNTYTSKAFRVNCKATSLNSNYCFVLKKYKHFYIWCGCFSTGDQREMAKGFVGKDFEILLEGKEGEQFWNDLGGCGAYTTSKEANNNNTRPSRLFHCTTISDTIKFEEILNFTQSDLIPEDLMLLDTHSCLMMWIGYMCSKEDKKSIIKNCTKYLQNDPAGRDTNIPIIEVKQCSEPVIFTAFFDNWNENYWNEHKPFEVLRSEMENGGKVQNGVERKVSRNDSKIDDFDQHLKFPITILTGANDQLPSKVDPLKKELHLTHDDFVSLFAMDYSEFRQLAKWKQQEMKKKVGLF